jgi:hypothetical protein
LLRSEGYVVLHTGAKKLIVRILKEKPHLLTYALQELATNSLTLDKDTRVTDPFGQNAVEMLKQGGLA